MPDQHEGPLVNEDIHDSLTGYLSRVLEHATPSSWVQGGASESNPWQRRPRNHDELQQREAIYQAGGPVTAFVDDRALMTYGTGASFETDSPIEDDQGRTVDEHLMDLFGDHLDLFMIDAGIQSYWSGDAWPEIVESRDGSFSHLELLDPTTVDPEWNRHGEITRIDQVIVNERGRPDRQPMDTDLVGHLTYKNSSGGPLGDSLVTQNIDEIERYAQNQAQRANAIRIHGSPKYDVSVGSEGQSIPDRIMRRIRNKFRADDIDEKTTWTHGGDIEIETLDSPGFEGMGDITETDIANLAGSMGIPLEWTNFGSAGLGEGTPAESRLLRFERQARAEQTRRSQQFIHEVVREIIGRYTPYPRDIDVRLTFGDVVSDQQAAADWMRDFKSYMEPDEVRERLDLPPEVDESELGPPEGTPDAEGQDISGPGGTGGLFTTPGEDKAPDPLDDDSKRQFTDGGTTSGRVLLHSSVEHAELTREELVWEDVFERTLWHDETDRTLFQFDPEDVPDFAIERLQDAIRDGALFEDYESIPDWAASRVGDTLLDSLDDRHGWSIDSIAENLQGMALGLDRSGAEVIARTETQALVNAAREENYREEFDLDQERFDWVGPDGPRTTDACEWIKDQIPDGGVRLDTLKELVQEANSRFIDSHDAREFTPHIQCRHTYTRQV